MTAAEGKEKRDAGRRSALESLIIRCLNFILNFYCCR